MNKSIKAVVAAFSLMLLSGAYAPVKRSLCEGFLPPNDMRIPADSQGAKGIAEEQFNTVMAQAEAIYAPIIAARGGELQLKRLWSDPTVNASADRQGTTYIVNMYGGLARHESITQDGMALVVCHELGHHLGGAPKYRGEEWASNEGQSDYFANMKCLHRIFSQPAAESFTRYSGDETTARASCVKAYQKPVDQDLCVRSAMAGMSVTTLFRILRRESKLPRFDTPDPKAVSRTNDNHPGTQCRLDTYYSGSLCSRPHTDELDETDPAIGACTRAQGFTVGIRPLCWYKPKASEAPAMATLPLPKSEDLDRRLEALRGGFDRGI